MRSRAFSTQPTQRPRTRLMSLRRDLFRWGRVREEVHNLSNHLLRDIGLKERSTPEWTRDLP